MGKSEEILRPDNKGRITLGKRAEGVSSYLMEEGSDGTLILHPRAEVPLREAWLHKNKEAMASVLRGLSDSEAGRTRSRGDFTQYINNEDGE